MATPNQQPVQPQQPRQDASTVKGKENVLCNYTVTFSEVVKFSIKDGVLHYDTKAQETTLHDITIRPKVEPQEARLTSIAKEDIVSYIDKNIVLLSEVYRNGSSIAETTDKTQDKSNEVDSQSDIITEANIFNKAKERLNKAGESLFSVEDKPKPEPTPSTESKPEDAPKKEGFIKRNLIEKEDPKTYEQQRKEAETKNDNPNTNQTEPEPQPSTPSEPDNTPPPTPRHEGIVNDVQADIYKGRDPKSFANISAIKDLSIVIVLNSLPVKNSKHIEKGKSGTILECKFESEEVHKYVNHFDLKRLKVFINNEEVQKPAKSELKFIATIFNGFNVKIKL